MNFLSKISNHKSNICLIDENDKVFLYKDVLKISEKISKEFKKRSLIFMLAQNHTEFITSYIGFFMKDMVQMLIDPKIEDNLFENLTSKYLPDYILIPISRKINLENYENFLDLKNHKILKIKKNISKIV